LKNRSQGVIVSNTPKQIITFTRPLTMAIKEIKHPIPNLPYPYACITTTTPKKIGGK
jgi:hypothetical protein